MNSVYHMGVQISPWAEAILRVTYAGPLQSIGARIVRKGSFIPQQRTCFRRCFYNALLPTSRPLTSVFSLRRRCGLSPNYPGRSCCSVDRSRHLVNGFQSSTSSVRGRSTTVKSEPGRYLQVTDDLARPPRRGAPAAGPVVGPRPTPPHQQQPRQMGAPQSTPVFRLEFGASAAPPTDAKFVRVNANWTT